MLRRRRRSLSSPRSLSPVPSIVPTAALSAAAPAPGAWASLAVVAALAFAIVGGAVFVARLLTRVYGGIHDPAQRLTTYECGEAPVGPAWFRFNNRFTTVALTFLVFDVELALLWPVLPRCVAWLGEGKGTAMFAEIAIYVGTLAIGLLWVAAGGGFEWDKTLSPDLTSPDLTAPELAPRESSPQQTAPSNRAPVEAHHG